MVRSKRKWKKDSPEKLTKRIENEIRKQKPPEEEVKSPETKKSKGTGVLPSDFSSGITLKPTVITNDLQLSVVENASPENNQNDDQENVLERTNTSISDIEEADKMEKTVVSEKERNEGEVAKEIKPQIEDTLSVITQSLNTLTQTIATMSVNMACKSDIAILQQEMIGQGKQISENTKLIEGKLSIEEGNQMAKKIRDHDAILKSNVEKLEVHEKTEAQFEAKFKLQQDRDINISNRIDGLAEALKKKNEETQKELEDIKKRLSEQNSEILSLKNGQRVCNVPLINQQDVQPTDDQSSPSHQHSKLNIIIEGLAETEDENLHAKRCVLKWELILINEILLMHGE